MENFQLKYRIDNKYANQVRRANFQFLVIPESTEKQFVTDLRFSCSGTQNFHLSKNIFGFDTIQYYEDKPFVEFSFKLSAKIEKRSINPYNFIPTSEEYDFKLLNSLEFYIDHHLFLMPTELTKLDSMDEINYHSYTGESNVFDYAQALNSFIFKFLSYSPKSTTISTVVHDILAHKKGVCQDYAHLFIAICRYNGIPARYVSGYLNQGADFTGSTQLHAWAEVFIPNQGWIGFDATNNLLVDHHYVKVAHGTDFQDCSPFIGVLESTGAQKSIHTVNLMNQ